MGLIFYCFLALAETILLFVRITRVKSAPVEAVLWGYSSERLILIFITIAMFVVCAYFLLQAVRRARGWRSRLDVLLNNDITVLRVVFVALGIAFALFFILIQEPPFFGDFYPIYTRLRPFVVWVFFLCLQTFIFLLFWYGLRFTNARNVKKSVNSSAGLAVLIAVFLLLILIKTIIIFPNSYGLIKRFGESKYILMARVFTEGVTLAAYNNPLIFHYPFLYPITLSFARGIENHSFTAIRLLNIVFTASAIFPVFLISRQLMGRKKSLLIAALSGVLPFQFLMPGQVLSENLYIPLFVWTVFFLFANPARRKSRLAWDILTGIFIGLLFLTRYITLAVIPFFLLLWWIKPFGKTRHVLRIHPRKLLHLLLIITCMAALYAPWLLFARRAGLTMSQAFGFGITADADPRQLTSQNVFTWLLLYLAYTILMLAPILGLLFSLGRRQLRLPRVKRWLALVRIISLAFLIPVVRHSWRAAYNLALPSRIMGRYIIFLPVLFLITAFLPLSVRPREPLTCRLSYLLRTILLPLALVVFSYFLIIRESIIPLKPGFISPFAAYDVYYMKLLGPWFWLFLVLLYAIPPFLARGAKPKIVRRLTALILVIFYMLALPKYFNVIRAAQYYERLGSRIVDLLREYGSEDGQALQVLLPDTIDSTSRADIGWAIRIHHFSADITVAGYAPDAWIEPTESPAIQVMPIEYADQVARDGRYERVFDNAFVVRMLLPERAYP